MYPEEHYDEGSDRLDQMFALQKVLQRDMPLGPAQAFRDMDFDAWKDKFRTHALSLVVELAEALGEVPWKPWATSTTFNREAYAAELVDAWCFLMNMCHLGDVTADELYAGYMRKQRVNRQRQVDGYDGRETKCPGCKRDLNEPGVHCGPTARVENRIRYRWCDAKGDWFDDDGKPLPYEETILPFVELP